MATEMSECRAQVGGQAGKSQLSGYGVPGRNAGMGRLVFLIRIPFHCLLSRTAYGMVGNFL